MARDTTQEIRDNTFENSTMPLYVVQIEHSGSLEYLSTSGVIEYDGITYEAGGVDIKSIKSEREASLSFFATEERKNESVGGTWRGHKVCKIYAIPAIPSTGDDFIFDAAEGILVLDGIIDTSNFDGKRVSVKVIQKSIKRIFTPRLNCSELSVYIPPIGSTFTWEGETYVLVSK